MKFTIIAFLLLVLISCKSDNVSNKRLIVCSTSIIADCISQIVGTDFSVVPLMGPGVDPHSYNPRPKDLKLLNSASIVIYNGFHLEGKMQAVFHQLSKRKHVIALAHFYPKSAQITLNKYGGIDPHIWFGTYDWLTSIRGATRELSLFYPKYETMFQDRFRLFQHKVRLTSKRAISKFVSIPYSQRVLITSHDAFHYFGNTFGLKVMSLQGVSTVQEPSLKHVYELVDFIVKHKVKALFIENSVSPKTVQLIIENAQKRNANVRLGGTLYSDALGPKNQLGGTYLGMIQHNCSVIYKNLK
jgi:manganese/zinc/iron transport system substrate-binding protein